MTDTIEQTAEAPSTEQVNTVLNTVTNSSNDTAINEAIEIPEKFKVLDQTTGSINYQATLNKLNESYSYLEKKVGTR